MFLNVYVPVLQTGAGASYFFRQIRGNPVPSSGLMAPTTRRFVTALEAFAKREEVWGYPAYAELRIAGSTSDCSTDTPAPTARWNREPSLSSSSSQSSAWTPVERMRTNAPMSMRVGIAVTCLLRDRREMLRGGR